MNKNKIKLTIIAVLCLAIFSLSIINMNIEKSETIQTNSDCSNKKIGWGIKRKDNNEQPELGKENKKLLEENNGICLGDNEKKYIYLTFDEGYEAGYTNTILDILKKNEVSATFFITAHYVNSQPDLVQKMINEGHIVGNHIPKFLMAINLKVRKV